MGSINRSHNEADGGILLFNGELILLYCDSVQCEIGGKESVKGRVYLTTHRLVMIVTPYRQSSAVKSLCAPFCAITRCNVEQPIFGANYIEATVRDETDSSKSFSFKLRFSKGGAIEFAMAMNRAVATVGRNFNPSMPPPPAYTPAPSSQYYQAPPTVYAPGYNCGVQMPVQQFPEQPPIGFIYASSAPPPYPGLGSAGQQQQQQPAHQAYGQQPPPYNQQPSGGYPGYPQTTPGGYPQQQPGAQGYPQQPGVSYPQQTGTGYPQQPGAGYPQQPGSGYPQQPQDGYSTQSGAGYPRQPPQTTGGYPQPTGTQQPGGYPQAPSGPSNPAQAPPPPASSSGYPDLSGQGAPNSAWPTAPSSNPNWQDEKK